eukprot:1155176-Pelagomonas_calceolata.AAC.1
MASDARNTQGYGTVRFSSPEEAQAALEAFNGRDCEGRALRFLLPGACSGFGYSHFIFTRLLKGGGAGTSPAAVELRSTSSSWFLASASSAHCSAKT